MRRRRLLGGGAAFVALAPVNASAQLRIENARPGLSPGGRPGVDEALRRTVSLVLRAEARRGGLPESMMDPTPLSDAEFAAFVVGQKLPDGQPVDAVPARINRRLPHAKSNSVWAVAGESLIEVDPVRLRVLSIAHDVLPPKL